jgi:hypothetical protein
MRSHGRDRNVIRVARTGFLCLLRLRWVRADYLDHEGAAFLLHVSFAQQAVLTWIKLEQEVLIAIGVRIGLRNDSGDFDAWVDDNEPLGTVNPAPE